MLSAAGATLRGDAPHPRPTALHPGAHPFGIGQQTQSLMGKREWDGVLDEARVMSAARDVNWAKLDFESQREGQKFLAIGATEAR